MTDVTTGSQIPPRPPIWGGRVAPRVSWTCAIVSVGIFILGIILTQSWWMLSFPVALVGAIAGGNSRRYFPMILCIVIALGLPLAILLQGI